MSPKLPIVSGREVVTALLRAGFDVVSTKGSHQKLRDGTRIVIVPLHREIKQGTLGSILHQAGIDADEFRSLLRRRPDPPKDPKRLLDAIERLEKRRPSVERDVAE